MLGIVQGVQELVWLHILYVIQLRGGIDGARQWDGKIDETKDHLLHHRVALGHLLKIDLGMA